MNITFGICVGENHNKEHLINTIGSIKQQNHSNFWEIVLIGTKLKEYEDSKVRIIDFDETQKSGWITRKKNILAHEAKYDQLCLMHDYFVVGKNWTEGVEHTLWQTRFKKWDIMVCPVYTKEGYNHAFWNVSPLRMEEAINQNPEEYGRILMEAAPHENHPKFVNGLPSKVRDLTHIQYISGGFIFCQRHVLLNVPFDENMVWGTPPGEDVEWSDRLSKMGYKYTYNEHSYVTMQKPNKWRVYNMPDKFVEILREYYGSTAV